MVAGFTLGERVRIDWWRVITDLERAGVSHAQISAHLGRNKSWVYYLKSDREGEPRHSDGTRLLALWASCTSRPVDAAPSRD